MDPDKYQQAWQAHSTQTRVTVDADLLLKEVQRNQGHFQATIFWRDFREVGVALGMLPLWFYLGVTFSPPWTWYLTVPALIWVIGFILVDRMRHPQRPGEPGEPLLESVKESLTQVEHQIWLLRNIFWWYLLPFTVSILAFFAHVAWLASKDWLEALGVGSFFFVFLLAIYSFIYYLNQNAVRMQLEPRRQELLTLLASLGDETTSEVSGEYPILMSAERVKCSRRRMFVASLCFVALLLIGIAGIIIASRHAHPEKSPFAAVRWQEFQPEVRVGEEWFKLVSLDDLAAAEIVAFSQRTYGNLWQKRFEEDLVEVLAGMGHKPKDTVQLVVSPLGSSTTRTLDDIPMTRANRRAIRDAAQARERGEQQPATQSNLPNPHNSTFAEEAKRGLDAFQRANFDQAISAWDEAIRLDPNHSEAHRWRGDASLNKHEFDKALSEYDEAIRLDSKNGMAYCSRGAAWTEKGDSDKAIASFDEAIGLDPTIANKPFYKRYREAAESLRAVRPISPKK